MRIPESPTAKVNEIISSVLASQVQDGEANLGADSLDKTQIAIELECIFGIDAPDRYVSTLDTANAWIAYVKREIEGKNLGLA